MSGPTSRQLGEDPTPEPQSRLPTDPSWRGLEEGRPDEVVFDADRLNDLARGLQHLADSMSSDSAGPANVKPRLASAPLGVNFSCNDPVLSNAYMYHDEVRERVVGEFTRLMEDVTAAVQGLTRSGQNMAAGEDATAASAQAVGQMNDSAPPASTAPGTTGSPTGRTTDTGQVESDGGF